MLDFDKLLKDTLDDEVTDPIEIFDLLPNKDKKYEELLRPAQQQVLTKWKEEYRDKKNVVIKMNTGSGKTVVGLLILQSYLNSGKQPAVYIVPDNYLVSQIIREAELLGIAITNDSDSREFLFGEAILVTNMHKIINGRSVFGVGEINKEIGCVVIDDAHACMKVAKSQFSINIPRDNDIYDKLITLFEESIKQQSQTKFLEIKDGEKNSQQLIPFWDWKNNLTKVTQFLHDAKDINNDDNKSLFFNWALIKDNLALADCIITGEEAIINLDYLPMEIIPSFDSCQHRIFMSATIEDDTVLASHFNISVNDIEYSITPANANDIGERMILIPQELNPAINDDQLKKYYKFLSTKVNVVILVPSFYRASYWEDVADVVVKAEIGLKDTIEKLLKGHVGLVILVNKYDGIDLPKDACSVLVIDGIPDVRSPFEKYEQVALRGSKQVLRDQIQKIEQGMGRGIRSKEDYCLVFLMGSSLVKLLYRTESKEFLTEATNKQLELSRNIEKQLRGSTLKELHHNAVKFILTRNPEWVKLSKAAIVKVKYNNKNSFNNSIINQREAFNRAISRDYRDALDIIQNLINEEIDDKYKGYLKFKFAKYQNFIDQVGAQQTMKSARKMNSQLLYPIEGIEYEKLQFDGVSQASKINEYARLNYKDTNEFILGFNALIDKLHFEDFSSNVFEEAIKDLGDHLGYISQRPENKFNRGPDNLWANENNCFVIECKNEAVADTICKDYCNQLNGSIEWFENHYPANENFVPIMIHPNTKFEYAATPNSKIRIMNKEKLAELRSELKEFVTQVAFSNYDITTIAGLLKTMRFEPNSFMEKYTVRPR